MLIPIEVTANDIRLGTTGEKTFLNTCAVGRAIKRALGLRGRRAEGLFVYHEEVEYEFEDDNAPWGGGTVTLATFPKKVRDVLERIDDGVKIEPFTFNLRTSKKAMAEAGLLK